jgi:hypothetical protein
MVHLAFVAKAMYEIRIAIGKEEPASERARMIGNEERCWVAGWNQHGTTTDAGADPRQEFERFLGRRAMEIEDKSSGAVSRSQGW